jgi:hypothetical protein
MEMQAIRFRDQLYCTVFVVQNQIITIMAKSSGPREAVRKWLQEQGYPSAGSFLNAKSLDLTPPGFYINPEFGTFYYRVDPVTDELTGMAPQDFDPPTPPANL